VALKKVTWDKGEIQPRANIFFYVHKNAKQHLRTGFFEHRGIMSAVRKVYFISDRMCKKN